MRVGDDELPGLPFFVAGLILLLHFLKDLRDCSLKILDMSHLDPRLIKDRALAILEMEVAAHPETFIRVGEEHGHQIS